MGSELALLLREHGISKTEYKWQETDDWVAWVAAEERRRTLLAGYVILNLQSRAFDIPPLILNSEVQLLLPDVADRVSTNYLCAFLPATLSKSRRV